MSERPTLPFRLLQRGLKAASRAGSAVVDRVLRSDAAPGPVEAPRGVERVVPEAIRVSFTGIATATVDVAPGGTILDAARAADVDLRYYCGGNCSCGTCRVSILEGQRNLSKVESMEAFVLGEEHRARGDRLACQAQVRGPVKVQIPEWF